MTTKHTTETFIQKAQLVHGDRYDYSLVNYTHSKTKVTILCNLHGNFDMQPSNHLTGNGCPICGRESQAKTQAAQAKSEFVQKSQEIHGDKYTYELVDYKNSKIKVIITCPSHGQFQQAPKDHLSGKQGCPVCASEESGFTRTNFKDKCIKNNNGLGILYILGCWSDDKSEVFIKIGITSRSIKERYRGAREMPYNYKILHEIVGSPEYVYDLETKLHAKSKNHKYIPTILFGGSSTECFIADKTYLNNLNSYISTLIPF